MIWLRTHLELLLKRGESMKERDSLTIHVRWVDYDAAFEWRLQTVVIINIVHKDTTAFVDDDFMLFEMLIRYTLNKHGGFKVQTELVAKFRKVDNDIENVELKSLWLQ